MFQGFLGIFSKKPLWGGAGGTVGSRRFDSNTHQIVPSSIGCWKMDFRIFHPAESLRLNGASPCYFGNEIFLMPQHCLANSGFFFCKGEKKTLPNFLECKCQFCRNDFSFVSSTSYSNTSSTLAPNACQYPHITPFQP